MTGSWPSRLLLRSGTAFGTTRRWSWLVVPIGVGLAVGIGSNPLLIVAALAGAGFFVAAYRWPVAALAGFVFLTFIGQIAGVGAGVSVAKGAGAVLVVTWLYRWVRLREGPLVGAFPATNAFIAGSIGLVGWMLISAAWSSDNHAALTSALRLAQGPLIALLMVATITSTRAFSAVVTAYVGGATLSALVGIAGVTQSDNASLVQSGRLSGGISDPNFLAAVLVPALVMSLFAFQALVSRWARVLVAFAGFACLAGLFLTESRGGIVALAVATVAAVAFAGPVRRSIVTSIAMTAAFAAFYFSFAPPQSLSRLTNFTAGGGAGRTDLWKVALNAFSAHPFSGVGAGNYSIIEPKFLFQATTQNLPRADLIVAHEAVHNTYLQIAAELGLVGVALFLFTLAAPLYGLKRVVALSDPADRRFVPVMGRGVMAGVLGMLAAFTFLTAEYEKQLWMTLGLVLAYNRIASSPNAVAEPASTAEPARLTAPGG